MSLNFFPLFAEFFLDFWKVSLPFFLFSRIFLFPYTLLPLFPRHPHIITLRSEIPTLSSPNLNPRMSHLIGYQTIDLLLYSLYLFRGHLKGILNTPETSGIHQCVWCDYVLCWASGLRLGFDDVWCVYIVCWMSW